MLAAVYFTAADLYVAREAEGSVVTEASNLEKRDLALVLGTSKYTGGGKVNDYYTARVKAAALLFKKGLVRGIVVSGDNSTTQYNEPQKMRQDLQELGVPGEYVTCDYAGFRTLDSIVRMKEIFGSGRYVIVSQSFHLARALYLARAYGQDAVGFAAEDPPAGISLKVRAREVLARGMALLDVNVLRRSPKFLGPPVKPGLRD